MKRTGDGSIIEFRSVVDAVRCAIEVQNGLIERNAGVPEDRRIELRVGIYVGDVVEESDGDLMGDGVNIAARLEGIAMPGTICLSEDAYRQVKGGLISLQPISAPPNSRTSPNRSGSTRSKWASLPRRSPRQSVTQKSGPAAPLDRRSTVRQHRRRPGAGAFRRRVTENLTTDLSRIRGAYATAPNTAFTYKGKPLDVKTIGRELNIRYVLEGSVQRGGSRLRVNVQRIDAETGNHLWAERFDKPLADLFDMQDEIVARLAGTLDAHLVAAEARRAERAPTPDLMDLYFQGLALLNWGPSPDKVAQARSFFDRALAADPENVDVLIGSARADMREGANFFVTDPMGAFAIAEAKLTRALSSVPDHARGHRLLGYVEILTKRAVQGIAECERALELDEIWPALTPLDRVRPSSVVRKNRGPHSRSLAPQSARY